MCIGDASATCDDVRVALFGDQPMSYQSSPFAAAATRPIIYLGIDVHKESITIAVLPAAANAPPHLAPHDRLVFRESHHAFPSRLSPSPITPNRESSGTVTLSSPV